MADTSRIEQALIIKFIIENSKSLHEEWPFFFIISFVSSEVHYRRIGFYLTKIRIYSQIDRKIAGDPDFRVQACITSPYLSVFGKRIAILWFHGLKACQGKRHDLYPA